MGNRSKAEIVTDILTEQNRPMTAGEIASVAPRRSGLTSTSVSQIILKRLKGEVEVHSEIRALNSSKVKMYIMRDVE